MYVSQILYNVFKRKYRAQKWYLRRLYANLTPEYVLVRMEDGTVLEVKPRYDYVQREIFLHQGKYAYEAHVVSWLQKNLHNGDVVVDVGSHVGYYLGPVCRAIGPTGKAFFIEPSPEHYALLQKNITSNQFTWAKPINTAISNQAGEINFYPAQDSGRNSLVKNKITNDRFIRIKATTLDQLCDSAQLDSLDFLQIDVEGAEVLVFQGPPNILRKNRVKKILCEWHPQQITQDFKASPEEMLENIARYGYKIFRINDQAAEAPFDAQSINEYQHLVFRSD